MSMRWTRRTTRRRTMTKLSSVITFRNHKIETCGFREDLNMMMWMRMKIRRSRKTMMTKTRTRRTTRRRTMIKLSSVIPFPNHKPNPI